MLFMSLLTAWVNENSHIVTGTYFLYRKNCPRPNFKGSQWQILISVKRSGKQLSTKNNTNAWLQISCANFGLKLCRRL